MEWTRLIVVDKGRTQVYDVNGGRIVIASVRSILNGSVRGMAFDEVEWAASEFPDVGYEIVVRKDDGNLDYMGNYYLRRFLTMYVGSDGGVRTVVNDGLQLGGWLRNNVLMELEGIYRYVREQKVYKG